MNNDKLKELVASAMHDFKDENIEATILLTKEGEDGFFSVVSNAENLDLLTNGVTEMTAQVFSKGGDIDVDAISALIFGVLKATNIGEMSEEIELVKYEMFKKGDLSNLTEDEINRFIDLARSGITLTVVENNCNYIEYTGEMSLLNEISSILIGKRSIDKNSLRVYFNGGVRDEVDVIINYCRHHNIHYNYSVTNLKAN